MTDVVLHHIANKQPGQEDTYYRIDQIKVVGLRRIEIVRQEVLYPVYDDFQYQCGKCCKDTYKKTDRIKRCNKLLLSSAIFLFIRE